MRDKLLHALGPTGRTHGAANTQPPPVWGT